MNRMKFIVFLVTLCYSVNSMTAFTSNENQQLSEIDIKSRNRVAEVVKLLDNIVNEQIDSNPEKKEQILVLREIWDITTQKNVNWKLFILKVRMQK
ncbi:Uncharacterised protein [Yersinia similis]|uniref:Secreted protein n=2 Tax=Yersinia similis TaxID=367190 RepID=A0A0T9R2X2_9GAMM|nr:Uncharacterised protein [Yersinia similis]CNI40599.1 Uncharacterised protein [Yersinia similis]